MNPVPADHDLAAAYRMGELQAHLRAEREAHTRAKYTNGYLLDLLSQQHKQAPVDGEAVLLQQRLAAAEFRVRELELELKLGELSRDGAQKIRARSPGLIHGVSGHVTARGMKTSKDSGNEIEVETPFSSKLKSGVKESKEEVEVRNGAGPVEPATDVPLAEWMQPVERQEEIVSEGRAKPQVKRYFGAPTSDAADGPYSTTAAAAVKDRPSSEPSPTPHGPKIHAPQPLRPPVAVNDLPVSQHSQEPMRYGRFERDQQRLPRSVARPPAMAGPYYRQHPPQLPRQHPSHFPPHFVPRAPAGNSRLPSYADLDHPDVPSFGGPIVHGPLHSLPSSGYTGFSEDLYDEPPPPAAKPQQTTTNTLQQSRHANPHWPTFSNPLHNRRHVDLRNIPESASLPDVMKQVTGFALLSVSPIRRVAAVVSPYRTAVTCTLTLEFARGDAAAAFVRSTAAAPIELPGPDAAVVVVVAAEQRGEASAPIPRALGEAVWARGAGRVLVIEEPGAALAVPANLRFQIENCAYAAGKGGVCGRLLQQPPEFCEDGAIRVVFRDVRDAMVAHGAWTRSPIFRNVGFGFEREGVLPELEVDEVEKRPESGKEVEEEGVEGKPGEDRGAASSSSSPCTSSSDNAASMADGEGEEDGGYAAGGSEDLDDSAAILGRPLACSSKHFDTTGVDVGNETSTDDEDDNAMDRDAPRRPVIKQGAFLNYDGSSDDLEEGEIREHPSTAPATPPFTPPTRSIQKDVLATKTAPPTPHTPAVQSGVDGEEQVFRTPGGTLFKPGTASPGRIRSLMGKSRWAS